MGLATLVRLRQGQSRFRKSAIPIHCQADVVVPAYSLARPLAACATLSNMWFSAAGSWWIQREIHKVAQRPRCFFHLWQVSAQENPQRVAAFLMVFAGHRVVGNLIRRRRARTLTFWSSGCPVCCAVLGFSPVYSPVPRVSDPIKPQVAPPSARVCPRHCAQVLGPAVGGWFSGPFCWDSHL